jgi:hypothetical protein
VSGTLGVASQPSVPPASLFIGSIMRCADCNLPCRVCASLSSAPRFQNKRQAQRSGGRSGASQQASAPAPMAAHQVPVSVGPMSTTGSSPDRYGRSSTPATHQSRSPPAGIHTYSRSPPPPTYTSSRSPPPPPPSSSHVARGGHRSAAPREMWH